MIDTQKNPSGPYRSTIYAKKDRALADNWLNQAFTLATGVVGVMAMLCQQPHGFRVADNSGVDGHKGVYQGLRRFRAF